MRVSLALLMILAIASSAQGQRRPPSLLQQAMLDLMENMGNMASRIGTGMMRTINGGSSSSSSSSNSIRNGPPRQRQRLANPQGSIPARQLDENSLPAPNAPQKQQQQQARPGLPQNRNRPSFRQFVDRAFSGMMNFMPRLRRRFNSMRSARSVQVSPSSIDRSHYDLDRESDSHVETVPPSPYPSTIHVTVNVHNGRDEEARPTSYESLDEADHSLSVTHHANHSVEVHHYPDYETSAGDYGMKTTNADYSWVQETTTTTKPENCLMVPVAIADGDGPNHSSSTDLNQYYNNLGHVDTSSQTQAHPHRELHITYNENKDDHKGLQYMYKYHSVNHQSPKDSNSNDGEMPRQMQHKRGQSTFSYSNGYLHGYQQGYDDGKITDGSQRNQWRSDTGRRGSFSSGKSSGSNMRIPNHDERDFISSSSSSSNRRGVGTNLRVQGSEGGGQVNGFGSQHETMPGCGVRCLWDDLMHFLDHYSTSESSGRVTGVSSDAGSLGLAVRQEVSGSASSNTPHGNSFSPNNNIVHMRTPNSPTNRPVMNNFHNAFGSRHPSRHVGPPGAMGRLRGDRRPPPPHWGKRFRPNPKSPSPHSPFHARSLIVDEGRVPSQVTWEVPRRR